MINFVAILDALPKVALAAWSNVWIATLAVAVAFVLASVIIVLRALRNRVLTAAINLVGSAVRGTPILIQIFIFYYGLPSLGLGMPPVVAGFCAITFNSAIFVSELMRGGLSGMDRGPIEAAIAMGLRRSVIWARIVLPQMWVRILPPLVGEMTMVVKATVLLSSITVVEVLRTAQQLASANYLFLEMLLAAGIVISLINLVFAFLGGRVEAYFSVRRG